MLEPQKGSQVWRHFAIISLWTIAEVRGQTTLGHCIIRIKQYKELNAETSNLEYGSSIKETHNDLLFSTLLPLEISNCGTLEKYIGSISEWKVFVTPHRFSKDPLFHSFYHQSGIGSLLLSITSDSLCLSFYESIREFWWIRPIADAGPHCEGNIVILNIEITSALTWMETYNVLRGIYMREFETVEGKPRDTLIISLCINTDQFETLKKLEFILKWYLLWKFK